jgi:hypothetical protein
MTASRLLLAALLTLAPMILGAQVPAGEPAHFLQRYIGLTSQQIEEAQRGAVVSKVLEAADRDEVALFGIVAIDAARSEVTRRLRDLQSFLRTPGRMAFGIFGAPASAGDAAAFVADPSDVEAIKKCRPASCDVKMPAATIDELRRAIDWSSSSAATQVSTLVRQRMVDYVEAYRAGGTSAMIEYGDQDQPRRSADVFASLLAESPYLYDYLPSFQEYLKGYPKATLAGVSDALYWSSDKMPPLRPILGITHLSIYAPPDAPLTLMSAKQLYASHYFLGAFTLTTILDRPGGVYYIVVERMRFDHLPSGGLLNIRGRVIGKMHDALRAELAQRKVTLERPDR